MKLTEYELKRVEDRAFNHWHTQKAQYPACSEWRDYWKANKAQCVKNGLMFKRLLSEQGFDRYLTDYNINPWTIHNIETMNG